MNILLVALDTLRSDHLGCYGYWRDTSPVMDRLADEGILFVDAHATAVATGPGFTSIHTGLAPVHHRFYLTPFNLPNLIHFDDDIPTLAEMVWDHGSMTTAAFDNLLNFRSHMAQFVRGYEYYVNVTRTSKWVHHHVLGGEVNKRLIPWLAQHKDEDFFAFVHYWDPHMPYNQPPPYRSCFKHDSGDVSDLEVRKAPAGYDYVPGWGALEEVATPPAQRHVRMWPDTAEYPIDLYDGEIRYSDALIADVVEALERAGILHDTLIIVTADHGEQLGQHGIYGHAALHEADILVPLILWNPGILGAPQRIRGYVEQADIVPTVLDLIAAPPRPELDGRSLLPIIRGEAEAKQRMFVETSQQRAIIHGPRKLIHDARGGLALYDIQADPMEIRNLIAEETSLADELQRELADWVRSNIRAGELDPMVACMDAREAAGLDRMEYDAPL